MASTPYRCRGPDVYYVVLRKRTTGIFSLAVILMLSACDPHLREYDPKLAREDFEEDMSDGLRTVLSVCHGVCFTPGFPTLGRMYCYPGSVSTRTIDSTRSSLISDEQLQLKFKAMQYATEYNSHLYRYLQNSEIGLCAEKEDWDSAYTEMKKLVATEKGDRSFVAPPPSLIEPFRIKTIGDPDWGELPTKVCRLFPENGIDREVLIEAASANLRESSKLIFQCVGGEVSMTERSQ